VPDLPPLNDRQAAFVREYLLSGNATDAYVKAGYSPKNARICASRMLTFVNVAAAIAAGRKKIEAKAEADFNLRLNDILATLSHQITADRNELTQHRRGACRYCHGNQNRFQWRTPREYSEAVEQHMLKGEAYQANHSAPDNEGGYGYRQSADPHPDCPECEGLGIGYTVLADTTKLSPGAAILFEGIKETRDGIQIIMPDRIKALETLGKHIGMFMDKLEVTGKDGQATQTEAKARIIIVPAKIPAQTTVRPMSDQDDIDPLADYDPQEGMP
jgi:phage terminase small subunit